MNLASHADCFLVINGPEDGTEFPVVRAPLAVGSDPSCALQIRLDSLVRREHAQLSAVADGYRVRSVGSAAVWVDNKRVGTTRSRIVRHGGALRVGNTLLCLECAPEGLASRSRGMVAESDFGWAVQRAVKTGFGLLGRVTMFAGRVLRRLASSWLAIGAMIFVAMVLWPQFRHAVINLGYGVYYRILNLLRTR